MIALTLLSWVPRAHVPNPADDGWTATSITLGGLADGLGGSTG